MHTQTFLIHGMHCIACTKLSAKKISKIDGVIETQVELETHTATLTAKRPITLHEINLELAGTEYRAEENQ